MTESRAPTIHWYECAQHGRKLQRSCPMCRAETGFTEAQWDYYVAKNRHPVVVLPLPLCSHGNVEGTCPAVCSRVAPQKATARVNQTRAAPRNNEVKNG